MKMKKLLIITIIIITSLLLLGKFVDHNYKKYWWPFFDKLDTVIKDSAYYDGIYLGDSRVHFGINPYYIDSANNLNTYNVGLGAATIQEINFLSASYLQKHPAPKFAVISIGYTGIINKKLVANTCYYSFYLTDSAVKTMLDKLNYHTSLYQILPVTKYATFDDFNKLSITKGLSGNSIARAGSTVYKGFINNTSNVFNAAVIEQSDKIKDTVYMPGIKVLEATIRLFQEKHTTIILIYPPTIHLKEKPPARVDVQMDSAITQLAEKYHTPLIHYDLDSSFKDELFSDRWHLNIKGTVLYSRKIAQDVKAILADSFFINR